MSSLTRECTEAEWRLSLFRAIKSLKLSMYKCEIDAWRRLDAKKRATILSPEELAEYERLLGIAEWVFDEKLPE